MDALQTGGAAIPLWAARPLPEDGAEEFLVNLCSPWMPEKGGFESPEAIAAWGARPGPSSKVRKVPVLLSVRSPRIASSEPPPCPALRPGRFGPGGLWLPRVVRRSQLQGCPAAEKGLSSPQRAGLQGCKQGA